MHECDSIETERMNERKCNDFRVRSKTDLDTPCKQIQPLSRIKTLNGPRVRRISPVGNEKVYREEIRSASISQQGIDIHNVSSVDLHSI